jgi:hypothetical protein
MKDDFDSFTSGTQDSLRRFLRISKFVTYFSSYTDRYPSSFWYAPHLIVLSGGRFRFNSHCSVHCAFYRTLSPPPPPVPHTHTPFSMSYPVFVQFWSVYFVF